MSQDVFEIANLESGPHREETTRWAILGGMCIFFCLNRVTVRLAFATSESNILHVWGVQRPFFIVLPGVWYYLTFQLFSLLFCDFLLFDQVIGLVPKRARIESTDSRGLANPQISYQIAIWYLLSIVNKNENISKWGKYLLISFTSNRLLNANIHFHRALKRFFKGSSHVWQILPWL